MSYRGVLKNLVYGGVATNPRNRALLEGALYLRLNPTMPDYVEMDTCDKGHLQMLRHATTSFWDDEPTQKRVAQLSARLQSDGV